MGVEWIKLITLISCTLGHARGAGLVVTWHVANTPSVLLLPCVVPFSKHAFTSLSGGDFLMLTRSLGSVLLALLGCDHSESACR